MPSKTPVTGNWEMPSATTMIAVSSLVVVGGKWANGEKLSVKLAIGIGGYAIGLAVMAEVSEPIASQIGLIVTLTVLFTYGHILAYKSGLTKTYPAYASSLGIKVAKK